MVLSNEPGYYEEAQSGGTEGFGIRVENLMVVVNKAFDSAAASNIIGGGTGDRETDNQQHQTAHETESGYLAFELLTLVPIPHKLIDFQRLTSKEVEWIDTYHRKVRQEIMPLLHSHRAQVWLKAATMSCEAYQKYTKFWHNDDTKQYFYI
jgi:Xaa-Pro aminopeptidase